LTQFLATFSLGKNECINFDKNGLCYYLGDFVTNSSGHPGGEADVSRKEAAVYKMSFSNYKSILFFL
jgi:hypothetical protein